MAALGLELRDFSGNEVPTKSVMIQEVRPPDWIPAAAIAQTVAEALEEGREIAIPSFIVIVLLVRRAREHGPLSRDRA